MDDITVGRQNNDSALVLNPQDVVFRNLPIGMSDCDDTTGIEGGDMLAGNTDDHAVNLVAGHNPRFLDAVGDRDRGTVDIDDDSLAYAARETIADSYNIYPAMVLDFGDDGAYLRGSDIEADYAVPGHLLHPPAIGNPLGRLFS